MRSVYLPQAQSSPVMWRNILQQQLKRLPPSSSTVFRQTPRGNANIVGATIVGMYTVYAAAACYHAHDVILY